MSACWVLPLAGSRLMGTSFCSRCLGSDRLVHTSYLVHIINHSCHLRNRLTRLVGTIVLKIPKGVNWEMKAPTSPNHHKLLGPFNKALDIEYMKILWKKLVLIPFLTNRTLNAFLTLNWHLTKPIPILKLDQPPQIHLEKSCTVLEFSKLNSMEL